MDTESFFVEFLYKGKQELAEVRPCCLEDNVFYYDIFTQNQYQFTITPSADEKKGMLWKISFKNADKNIENELYEAIGMEIEQHFLYT